MAKPLSYKEAGVDIQAGNELVDKIKPYIKKTHGPNVLANIGGFGALFELSTKEYQTPVLVSSTDGVGTKLRLAISQEQHDSIGIDLVAMCANDLVVMGAKPLFFLDYYATGKLSVNNAKEVIKGIAKGCSIAKMALIGGETAEMPDHYQASDYDLAGFCVGIVDKPKIIDGSTLTKGDILVGLASSGVHSNGFSLIRKILSQDNIPLSTKLGDKTLKETLLTPTKIYVNSILKLCEKNLIKMAAHITGGGLIENIPRVCPNGYKIQINPQSWQWPAIFSWLLEKGKIELNEMYRTFNCGIGMVIGVSPLNLANVLAILKENDEQAWVIGNISLQETSNSPFVEFTNEAVCA